MDGREAGALPIFSGRTYAGRHACYGVLVPARIVVDEAVPEAKRPPIVDCLRAALNGLEASDSLIAVVSRLPDGRLRVFVNHIEDASFVATIEAALARL